jgi:hypothetical protein
MKNSKNIVLLILMFTVVLGYGQQTQQKIDMEIDAVGNAKIDVSMTMNAQQWQVWIANLGNNPAALKREVERSMPAYFLDDFKLEKDEMNRSFNLSLNAYGVCEINKRGVWTIDTDQKNANLTELTSHKYMLVSSPEELGGTVQQTFTISFPPEAENIEIDKDALGNTIFKFDMENSAGGMNLMLLGGIFFMVVGAGWSGVSLLTGKS